MTPIVLDLFVHLAKSTLKLVEMSFHKLKNCSSVSLINFAQCIANTAIYLKYLDIEIGSENCEL